MEQAVVKLKLNEGEKGMATSFYFIFRKQNTLG